MISVMLVVSTRKWRLIRPIGRTSEYSHMGFLLSSPGGFKPEAKRCAMAASSLSPVTLLPINARSYSATLLQQGRGEVQGYEQVAQMKLCHPFKCAVYCSRNCGHDITAIRMLQLKEYPHYEDTLVTRILRFESTGVTTVSGMHCYVVYQYCFALELEANLLAA